MTDLQPTSRAAAVLAAVHRHPGVSRAQLIEELGLSSGQGSEVVARLVASGYLTEGDPEPSGGRGRPTRTLWHHPTGPLVVATAIFHEIWRLEVCELGGHVIETVEAEHDRDPEAVLGRVAGALRSAWSTYGERIRSFAVAVPGTVSGTRLVQAAGIGWQDVELLRLRPKGARAVPLIAGNDARLSAVAEQARGAAVGTLSSVHVFIDSGLGGALIEGGRVLDGMHGMNGEFGHLPFGSRTRRCRCGALGCWNTDLDAVALARHLGRPVPADEVSFSRAVLAAAADGDRLSQRAAAGVARALGRGLGGLVNACDPELVILSGLAGRLLAVSPGPLRHAYDDGLMSTRRADAPPLAAGVLGERAPLVGAMELGFADVISAPVLS